MPTIQVPKEGFFDDIKEMLRQMSQENDRRSKEADRRSKEADRRLKEADLEMKELKAFQKEVSLQMKDTDRRMKETDLQIKETSKKISDIGEKFGYFTEGMALPSMEKILEERFNMDVVLPRVKARNRKDGTNMEIDVLSYANGEVNAIYLVEIKSKLTTKGIKQTISMLNNFFKFFPEHKGKKLYGILAAVQYNKHLQKQVLKEGLYFACIHEEVFDLKVPRGFEARKF